MPASLRLPCLVLCALFIATACQPVVKQQDLSVNTGKVLTLEEAGTLNVGKINIVPGERVQEDSAPALVNLKADLEKALPQCATGPNAADLYVRVDNFRSVDGLATVLIAGEISMDALFELRDPANDQLIGEYYMSVYDAAAGLLGAAKLSGADKKLPNSMAASVCEQVFGVKLPEEKRPEHKNPLDS